MAARRRRTRKPRLGIGKRFSSLVTKLKARKGRKRVRNPQALAAWIGRRKYGKKRMAGLARQGRRRRKVRR